jgi:hypothetical protein
MQGQAILVPNAETRGNPRNKRDVLSQPRIGDMRVTFRVIYPHDISLIAKQRGDTFVDYTAKNGKKLSYLRDGIADAAEMFESARSGNSFFTWVVRLVGFMMMFFGLSMVLKPLSVLADVLPILGDIVETYAWTRRPVWPQGMPDYPSFTTPVPGTLDWDLWIGSAEKRPYADKWPDDNPIPKMCPEAWKGAAVYHPFNHRGWYDFGAGALGDMGCHWANTIYKALDLDHPSMISASCTRRSDVAFPLASVVTFDYPKRGNFPELRFTWCDGLIKPPAPKELAGAPLPKEGVMYVGTKAKMLIAMEGKDGMRILDPKLDAQAKTIPATLPRRGQIWDEWMTACKGGERAGCDFAWARRITEFVLLGNLAVRTGGPVAFDPKTMHVANNPDADALLRLKYYNGWSL